jgi:hypothetical protein
VQLVDARELWVKMRKSLAEKRKQISPEQIEEITWLYGAVAENEWVKVFRNEQLGYQRITVERTSRLRYAGEGARGSLEASKVFCHAGGPGFESRAPVLERPSAPQFGLNGGSGRERPPLALRYWHADGAVKLPVTGARTVWASTGST